MTSVVGKSKSKYLSECRSLISSPFHLLLLIVVVFHSTVATILPRSFRIEQKKTFSKSGMNLGVVHKWRHTYLRTVSLTRFYFANNPVEVLFISNKPVLINESLLEIGVKSTKDLKLCLFQSFTHLFIIICVKHKLPPHGNHCLLLLSEQRKQPFFFPRSQQVTLLRQRYL